VDIRTTGNEDTFMTLKEWRAKNGNSGQPNQDIMQIRRQSFPLAWRGYITDPDSADQFPNFGASSVSMATGLDNAIAGDIVVMNEGLGGSGDARSLPRLAYVKTIAGDYVDLIEVDNGKWPDVCGGTDGWSEAKTRTVYRPGKLPERDNAEFEVINWTTDCSDPHLSICEASNWDTVKVYRPTADVRNANDGSEMKKPTAPTTPATPVTGSPVPATPAPVNPTPAAPVSPAPTPPGPAPVTPVNPVSPSPGGPAPAGPDVGI
jgi:hypothetical protein